MGIITLQSRDLKAKGSQLRRAGIVPCIIYGGNLSESIPVQLSTVAATKLFFENREGSKVQLKVGNRVILAQIKDKTWDIVKSEITHISFQILNADQRVNSVAHIILQNADKVKGILEKLALEIPYSSTPEYMIDTVTLDLDGLPVGTVVSVADIPEFKTGKVELQLAADSIIFRIRDKKGLQPAAE